MQSSASRLAVVPPSLPRLWAGRVLSALPVLFLLLDGVMKLFNPAPVVEAMGMLGYRDGLAFGIGLLALACLAVYLMPRTAVLGAVMLTGYLGGAVASHVRIGSEPFPVILPIILGVLIWSGLLLRDDRARALIVPRW